MPATRTCNEYGVCPAYLNKCKLVSVKEQQILPVALCIRIAPSTAPMCDLHFFVPIPPRGQQYQDPYNAMGRD